MYAIRSYYEAGIEQRFLREPYVEVHAEVFKVAPAVFELFGQHVVVA